MTYDKQKRNKMLSIIHIQKKQLGLTDDEYRTMIFDITSEDSASKMNYKGLSDVINNMNRLLDKKGIRTNQYGLGYKKESPFLKAVKGKATRVLGSSKNSRLNGFLKKMNKNSLEECNPQELRRIMGFLSTVEKNRKKGS